MYLTTYKVFQFFIKKIKYFSLISLLHLKRHIVWVVKIKAVWCFSILLTRFVEKIKNQKTNYERNIYGNLLGGVERSRGAKGDDVIRFTCACEEATRIVVGVAKSARARPLEYLRIRRRRAWFPCSISASTAILGQSKRPTRAHACDNWLHHAGVSCHPQLVWTHCVQIDNASDCTARLVTLWSNNHRKVIAVNQWHVVEVLTTVAEAKLG